MRLEFVPLDKLSVSKTNMRWSKRPPDVSDILPTIRAKGVLQTLLVRPNGSPTSFEIVAGSRRFHAASLVAEERLAAGDASPPEPLPCAILDDADDAAAVEASLIENMARLDASEVQQWVTFTRLVREGRSVEHISLTFGLPELTVKRVLALGNLLPRIRALYAAEDIDRATVRHLTMATKRQQQDWLALVDDPESYAPKGANLKAWLLGGSAIPVAHALFDLEGSGLAVVADLFGESACFADATAFWAAQNEAIEARRAGFLADGWSDAVIIPPSDYFQSWEYEKRAKRNGGRVYLDVRSSGEVTTHEGYVSRREAKQEARSGETGTAKAERPELTATMNIYVDLHRHAAVRADLTAHPGVALRLMVATAITGSPQFRVTPEPQTTRDDDVRQSVYESPGEAVFDERRRAVLGLIGASPEDPTVTGGNGDEFMLVTVFHRLLDLPDAAVMDVIAIVMGEGLAAGSAAVDAVAGRIGTDMADWWEADAVFLRLVRDRAVLTAMVAEVAGSTVAEANAKETGKTMKTIIANHLAGTEGRPKVERWVPKWLAFPPAAYTERGGVGAVRAHNRVTAALAMAEDERRAAMADPDAGTSEPPLVPEAVKVEDADATVESASDDMPLAA